jgi:glycosyltransferase involved in cell wall biosynthesis
MSESSPRVTLGIATYNRDAYLGDAVRSALAQDYDDFEVLVVCDGTSNPAVRDVLDGFDDPRLRVVCHDQNLGIAAAYNSFITCGRGELIAMVGDDDLCGADRLRRQVEIFDRFPDTGVVHGDAVIIDADGTVVGSWPSRDYDPAELVAAFFRSHNHLVDPTRMVSRRVYEAVGGYSADFPIAQDLDFWLRAGRRFRFRHCPGGPVVAVRRHGENASDESARGLEIADVERALESAMELYSLAELVPEVDWVGLEPNEAERAALLALADLLEQRRLPLPSMSGRLRTRATSLPAPRPSGGGASAGCRGGRRIVITAFGWNDSGGGTAVPRLAAKELARRGWDVTVFHAAVGELDGGGAYATREWDEDGVHLVGVHNRPSVLFDAAHPEREIDDPPIAAAFALLLDRVKPDVVHFHNLHNLGASLFDLAAARGIPSFFSTHNYWLVCPRAYLLTGDGTICPGPGDRGGDCATCVGGQDRPGYQRRLAEIRARAERSLTACLAVSHGVRRTLLAEGYAPELIDVVRQAMPQDRAIWERVGATRSLGRVGDVLTVGFVGSAYPHKGPQLLIEAAQRTAAELRVRIHGEVPARFADQLRSLDRRGVVELCGAFTTDELPELLAGLDAAALPSLWWDCAPLAATECRAARLPLLVPRLGGLAEVVTDACDGLIFDGLDADDLALKLDRLAGEPGLLERLQGEIAPPRTFEDYVDELEAYYRGERPGRVSDEDASAGRAVRWQGDHGLALSLSIVNREITQRLSGPVQRVGRDGAPAGGEPPLPHVADVEVRHQWPPDLRPAPSGRLAVIQPWEFGAIPRSWVGPLRENVDELWVPSEYVRRMYLDAGLDPQRVVTVANGVDLDVFRPAGARYPLDDGAADGALRFLFHGGLIWRKGHDLLLAAWREAFAARDDVVLVVKTVGADGVYRTGEGAELREHAATAALPRVVLVTDELSDQELAGLYRACDVFVHPYRGEGFAMGVLEAMACGVPSIVTDGGPTNEFCPDDACWRIRSQRAAFAADRVDNLDTVGRPWVLEPDRGHLVELLRVAAEQGDERRRRGLAAAAAAASLSWDAVAARYGERIDRLAAMPPRGAVAAESEPYPLSDAGGLRVLATPAWRGSDRLGELLATWCTPEVRASQASLILLADPSVDGTPEDLEARVRAAADEAGCELDSGGDINIVMEPMSATRDARLHAAVDAVVVLHGGAPGHERLARAAGNRVFETGSGELERLLQAGAVVLA